MCLLMDNLEKIDNQIVIKDKKEILNNLLSFIKNITIINEDTIGVSLDKNIIIHNNQNTMVINKGMQINLAKQIHLNPRININELYDNTDRLEEVLKEAYEKEKEKQRKKLLEHKYSKSSDYGCCSKE
jgi:signal transduction histidine kinase